MAAVEVDVAGELVEAAGVDAEAEDEADGDQHQHDERADAARLARAAAHLPRAGAPLFLRSSSSSRRARGRSREPRPGGGRSRKGEALLPLGTLYLLARVRSGRQLGSGRVVSSPGVRARPRRRAGYKGRGRWCRVG